MSQRRPQRASVPSTVIECSLPHMMAAHGTRPGICHPRLSPAGCYWCGPHCREFQGLNHLDRRSTCQSCSTGSAAGLDRGSGGLFRTPDLDGSSPLRGAHPLAGKTSHAGASTGPLPEMTGRAPPRRHSRHLTLAVGMPYLGQSLVALAGYGTGLRHCHLPGRKRSLRGSAVRGFVRAARRVSMVLANNFRPRQEDVWDRD